MDFVKTITQFNTNIADSVTFGNIGVNNCQVFETIASKRESFSAISHAFNFLEI